MMDEDLWFSNMAAHRSHQSILMPGSHIQFSNIIGMRRGVNTELYETCPRDPNTQDLPFYFHWAGTSSSQLAGLQKAPGQLDKLSFADLGCATS